jgi:hypothetical protein
MSLYVKIGFGLFGGDPAVHLTPGRIVVPVRGFVIKQVHSFLTSRRQKLWLGMQD